ncbi:unnamed protein product [Caenorhabditis nigoni]
MSETCIRKKKQKSDRKRNLSPNMTSKQKDDLDFFFCRLMEHKSSFLDTISKRLPDYEKAEIHKINYNADLFASRLDSSESTLNTVKAIEQFFIVRRTWTNILNGIKIKLSSSTTEESKSYKSQPAKT